MAAVRHGSRWLHEPPTEDEVKEWFEQQPLHPGMSHGPYMGGIVLIGATEKYKVSKLKANKDTFVAEMERAVFTPYLKVDTRIAYFRDYVRSLNGGSEQGNFVGVIEPVEQPRITDPASPYFNGHLPKGFAVMPVGNQDKTVSRFLVCTQRVAIYERESYVEVLGGRASRPLIEGIGTKQTVISKRWADDNALMKAETGAVGRALGIAGVLVVGTGVATAEDMQEAQAGPSGAAGAGPEGATVPADEVGGGEAAGQPVEAQAEQLTPQAQDEQLRVHARTLQKEMEEEHPEAWVTFRAWWKQREFPALSELTGPALKGAITKLERDLDAAKKPNQGAS